VLKTGGVLAAVLTAACEAMTRLGIVPLRFEADEQRARILAEMPPSALGERSMGPYSADRPPPEAIRMVDLVGLRWWLLPQQPQFTVGMAGPWPELTVTLPTGTVQVRYIVPEAAPGGFQPAGGDLTVQVSVVAALRMVAASLAATEQDLPVRLRVDHQPEPVVELDRQRCTQEQRQAHNAALRATAGPDQRFDRLEGTAFRTWRGGARIQDPYS
jgi:hypothetical protein